MAIVQFNKGTITGQVSGIEAIRGKRQSPDYSFFDDNAIGYDRFQCTQQNGWFNSQVNEKNKNTWVIEGTHNAKKNFLKSC